MKTAEPGGGGQWHLSSPSRPCCGPRPGRLRQEEQPGSDTVDMAALRARRDSIAQAKAERRLDRPGSATRPAATRSPAERQEDLRRAAGTRGQGATGGPDRGAAAACGNAPAPVMADSASPRRRLPPHPAQTQAPRPTPRRDTGKATPPEPPALGRPAAAGGARGSIRKAREQARTDSPGWPERAPRIRWRRLRADSARDGFARRARETEDAAGDFRLPAAAAGIRSSRCSTCRAEGPEFVDLPAGGDLPGPALRRQQRRGAAGQGATASGTTVRVGDQVGRVRRWPRSVSVTWCSPLRISVSSARRRCRFASGRMRTHES